MAGSICPAGTRLCRNTSRQGSSNPCLAQLRLHQRMPPGHLCHVDTFVMGMPLSRPSLLPAVLPPRHRIWIWDCYSMLISPPVQSLPCSTPTPYIPYVPYMPYMLYIKLQDAAFSRPALLAWQELYLEGAACFPPGRRSARSAVPADTAAPAQPPPPSPVPPRLLFSLLFFPAGREKVQSACDRFSSLPSPFLLVKTAILEQPGGLVQGYL